MKKSILSILLLVAGAFGCVGLWAQSTNQAPAIVVTDVTPAVPAPAVVHRVAIPSTISGTLAPQLLAQIDPQHPTGKVVSRMVIVRNADGSYTATISYVSAP